MNLEEFKKAVETRLLELSHGNTTWVNGCLTIREDSIWEEYFRDFSENGVMNQKGVNAVAGGIVGGLI